MNLDDLKGKKFRYDSPLVGISDWIDTVDSIIHMRKCELRRGKTIKDISAIGHKITFHVRGKKTGNVYEFERCIFINEEND